MLFEARKWLSLSGPFTFSIKLISLSKSEFRQTKIEIDRFVQQKGQNLLKKKKKDGKKKWCHFYEDFGGLYPCYGIFGNFTSKGGYIHCQLIVYICLFYTLPNLSPLFFSSLCCVSPLCLIRRPTPSQNRASHIRFSHITDLSHLITVKLKSNQLCFDRFEILLLR